MQVEKSALFQVVCIEVCMHYLPIAEWLLVCAEVSGSPQLVQKILRKVSYALIYTANSGLPVATFGWLNVFGENDWNL